MTVHANLSADELRFLLITGVQYGEEVSLKSILSNKDFLDSRGLAI